MSSPLTAASIEYRGPGIPATVRHRRPHPSPGGEGWDHGRSRGRVEFGPLRQDAFPAEPPPQPAEPLADGLFLAAHDDFGTVTRLRPLRLSLGLAGALLGELIYAQRIDLAHGRVMVIDHRPPLDALCHLVHEQICAEPDSYPTEVWLGFLRAKARDLVGDRLVRRGLVELRERRRGRTEYVPARQNPTAAAWPGVRVFEQVRRLGPLCEHDVVLAGLMAATGLHRQYLHGADRSAHDHLSRLIGLLPASLHELVVHTTASVDRTVSAGRG